MRELINDIHTRLLALGSESSEPMVEKRIGEMTLAAVRADSPVSTADFYSEFGLGS